MTDRETGPRRRGPDLVRLLIADVGRPRPPTAAEERALAARIAAGGPDGAAARRELAARNLPLALRVARDFARRQPGPGADLPELVGWACVGLMAAVDAFDPAAGRFTTLATTCALRAVRKGAFEGRLVRVPACVLGTPRGPAAAARRAVADRALGAAVLGDPAEVPGAERWTGPEAGPAAAAAAADEARALRRWLAELGRRDARLAAVLTLRYGLDGRGVRTYAAAGAELGGVYRDRVRALEGRALEALREIAGRAETRRGA